MEGYNKFIEGHKFAQKISIAAKKDAEIEKHKDD